MNALLISQTSHDRISDIRHSPSIISFIILSKKDMCVKLYIPFSSTVIISRSQPVYARHRPSNSPTFRTVLKRAVWATTYFWWKHRWFPKVCMWSTRKKTILFALTGLDHACLVVRIVHVLTFGTLIYPWKKVYFHTCIHNFHLDCFYYIQYTTDL